MRCLLRGGSWIGCGFMPLRVTACCSCCQRRSGYTRLPCASGGKKYVGPATLLKYFGSAQHLFIFSINLGVVLQNKLLTTFLQFF